MNRRQRPRRRADRRLGLFEHLEGRLPLATVIGLSSDESLIQFDSADPATILFSVPISGLQTGDSLLGIDFRPATGELFGLGSESRLYTINPATGEATPRGNPFDYTFLPNRKFGFDFNPVTDEIRVISNWEENIRLDPDSGELIATDEPLAYVAGDPNFGLSENPVAIAYTNNFPGATTTTLFNVNTFRDVLARQGGANVPPGAPSADSGQLTTIGPLGIDAADHEPLEYAAFDIHTGPDSADAAFAVLTTHVETTGLYSINLATGAATLIGNIGPSPTLVRGMAVVPALAEGLVHHWTFDETTGDIAHDSAGVSDGTLVNWSPTEARWEPGRVGGALRFGTSNNYVIAPQQPASGTYSVSFWLNVAERTGVHPRILNYRFGNIIYINNETTRGVSFSANETANTFSPEPSAFNTWEHYAINFNATTLQGVIYRSGAPVAIGTFVDSASMQSWVLGHHFDLANHDQSLRGALDDLRIYNRLLTDDDIAQLANIGIPEPVHQEPVHHWTFDETTGFTAQDIAGGADGTLVNWSQSEPRWEPGRVGGALRFSTDNNAVVTPALGTGARWSVAFWLNVKAKTGLNPRILTGPDTGTWAYLNFENDLGMSFFTSRSTITSDPAPIITDQWVHYAITFDTIADVGTIYRNGIPVVTGLFADNAPAAPWVFGHNNDLNNPLGSLDGLLDDLRYYDRLLAATEIQQLAEVAVNDAYEINEDVLLDIAAAQGVLQNDINAPFGSTVAVETDPLHGALDLNADGSFTYDPDENYNGPDSFTYRLTDPDDHVFLATVSLTIKPVNDAPTFLVGADRFVDDEAGSRGITHWASQVTAGPPDEANQTLTFEAIADKPELLAVQPKVVVVDGTLPGLWGRLTYTLARNKTGVVTVTIRLKDNGGTDAGGIDTTPTQTFKINIAKAHPGHNAIIAMDVNDDGAIVAGDALSIINYVNTFGSTVVPPETGAVPPYYDVTADGNIAADDSLAVINYLNFSQPGFAQFVETDTATQGNWQSRFGAEGYAINSGATNLPDYAIFAFQGYHDRVWANPTTDIRALSKPGVDDRMASAWTENDSARPVNGFILDLNLTDGELHRVALYILDWDTTNRTQRMEVLDANTGQVLDTQLSGPFHDGKYLVWMLKGHVKIRFANLANGLNAVASGVFFD